MTWRFQMQVGLREQAILTPLIFRATELGLGLDARWIYKAAAFELAISEGLDVPADLRLWVPGMVRDHEAERKLFKPQQR